MHFIRSRQCSLHSGSQAGKQSLTTNLCHPPFDVLTSMFPIQTANNPIYFGSSMLLSQVGLRPVHGKFEIRDVGNLGTVVHEASRSLSFLLCFLPTFVSQFCILPSLLQILGQAVRFDKGHNCQRTSSDRHNSHPGCSVLPIIPYDSPVPNTEVRSLSEKITVDLIAGTELPRVHATTWRTQTGRWQ